MLTIRIPLITPTLTGTVRSTAHIITLTGDTEAITAGAPRGLSAGMGAGTAVCTVPGTIRGTIRGTTLTGDLLTGDLLTGGLRIITHAAGMTTGLTSLQTTIAEAAASARVRVLPAPPTLTGLIRAATGYVLRFPEAATAILQLPLPARPATTHTATPEAPEAAVAAVAAEAAVIPVTTVDPPIPAAAIRAAAAVTPEVAAAIRAAAAAIPAADTAEGSITLTTLRL